MRASWQERPLADVCQFLNGLWKGEKPPFVTVGVIRNTNFAKDGTLDASEIAYLDVEVKKFEKRRLELGDIILEKSGGGPKQPVGRVALFDLTEGEFSFSNFTSALRVLDPDSLDFRFLHKFLHWTYLSGVTEGMQSHSTGIRNLDGDAYKSIAIPVPKLPEQRRIASVLDDAFDGVATANANAEKNLLNARALFATQVRAVFDLEWKRCKLVPLSELATEITDGDHLPPPKSDSGVPFITIGNINKVTRTIDFTDTFTVPREYFNRLKMNRRPKRGDVLYTVTGSFGIPVIVQDDFKFCFQRHIALIRPKPETQSSWLYYLLLSPQVLMQAIEGATGTAQKTVSLKVLRGFMVPRVLPRQQQSAVAMLDALSEETRHLESIYRQKLAALGEFKKSLLHEAFNGRL